MSIVVAPSSAGFAASASVKATGSTLVWHTCDVRFECSTLAVPIDYARPSGPKLNLSIIRLRATHQPAEGDIVMNPGGPGESGVQTLEESASSFAPALRAAFNLVSFDPRGAGSSDPVECLSTAEEEQFIRVDPEPSTPAEVAGVVAAAKAFVAGCEAMTPRLLLDHVGTADTVRDLESLRIALGDRALNYIGFSYGTYIGELYAQEYPGRIRAMDLDGVVDPALSSTEADLEQAEGFEADLHSYFAWCATNVGCTKALPAGARASYTSLITRLRRGVTLTARLKPLYGGTQTVDLGMFETAVAAALYSMDTWPDLSSAIAAGLAGDGGPLAALALSYEGLQQNGTFSDLASSSIATGCEDDEVPASLSAVESLAARFLKAAPDFGGEDAWGVLPCLYWPVRASRTPAPIAARSSKTILVVGSTGDPATPYSGAVAVAHELAHAVLLTRSGSGHTAYLASSCVRTWVTKYFTTLATPPPGTDRPQDHRQPRHEPKIADADGTGTGWAVTYLDR